MKSEEQFINDHPKGHFMQSKMWGDVKRDWKREVLTVKDKSGEIKGAMSILIRKLPVLPYKMMYSPRGPVCDIKDVSVLKELTQKVAELAKKERAYIFKIDPDVEVEDQKFIADMQAIGYKRKHSKNFEGIQPNFVFRLDVENKTEEEVMAGFHSKTRYNIRVAIKNGVEISLGSQNDLKEFTDIMVETGVRDGFVIRSIEYFERMYDVMGDNIRLYIARLNGKMIAGTIAIYYGDKVWYLYGASSNDSRNAMPNYLLQWEMIKWAIEKKCRVYDFRGVSGEIDESNPLYGLYRFKKGYGGKLTEFVGELEVIYNPLIAFLIDRLLPAFIEIRRKLFLKRNS